MKNIKNTIMRMTRVLGALGLVAVAFTATVDLDTKKDVATTPDAKSVQEGATPKTGTCTDEGTPAGTNDMWTISTVKVEHTIRGTYTQKNPKEKIYYIWIFSRDRKAQTYEKWEVNPPNRNLIETGTWKQMPKPKK